MNRYRPSVLCFIQETDFPNPPHLERERKVHPWTRMIGRDEKSQSHVLLSIKKSMGNVTQYTEAICSFNPCHCLRIQRPTRTMDQVLVLACLRFTVCIMMTDRLIKIERVKAEAKQTLR